MQGTGYVPCAAQEEPNPGPGGDVRDSRGATVGEHVIRELERPLMELMESTRRGGISCENGGRG